MKILQETEKRLELYSRIEVDITTYIPENPESVILLLHGLSEKGKRIYRKLISYLPQNAIILAPNAPFPIQRESAFGTSYGFTWYFYNMKERSYFIDQTTARYTLKEILKTYNPTALPLTIIGFSQGGYLAPLVGMDHQNTKLVLGLGCEFRETLIKEKISFPLVGIHGEDDDIISPESSFASFEKVKHFSPHAEWLRVPNTKHEINAIMGEKVSNILEKFHGERSL